MEKSTIIITGASGSMGCAATKALSGEGWRIIMACRNLEKGEAVRRRILEEVPEADLCLKRLDLGSLASVKSFAAEIAEDVTEGRICLSGLFNNAGTINRDFKISEDGYEQTLAVNFIGPAVLTELLLPHFEDGAHIVSMVSLTCGMTELTEDFTVPRKEDFRQLRTYAKSKLALLLYTLDLSRRTEGRLHVNMADPGIVNSNMISMDRWFDPLADLLFRPFCKSPERGAAPAIRAMLSPESARFFVGGRSRSIPERYFRMDAAKVTSSLPL